MPKIKNDLQYAELSNVRDEAQAIWRNPCSDHLHYGPCAFALVDIAAQSVPAAHSPEDSPPSQQSGDDAIQVGQARDARIEVNGLRVDIVRKNIKNLHLGVYPPDGRVRVAAPLRLDDDAVRQVIISRLPWIKRQQLKFQEQKRQTACEYVNGESHYFRGERYRLNIIEQPGRQGVSVRALQFLDLTVHPGSDAADRQRVMAGWYRAYLRQNIPPLIEKWQPILGVEVADWGIKHMKTKWGTCNIAARRIWLNLELAKKPDRCLEYVVVHEMVHLLERLHNKRFMELMNQFLPQWRLYREELNSITLTHDEWEYQGMEEA